MWIQAFFILSLVIGLIVEASIGDPVTTTAVSRAPQVIARDFIEAHGGSSLHSIGRIDAIVTRVTPKGPLECVERQLFITIKGQNLRVEGVDPARLQHRVEVVDGSRGYSAWSFSEADPVRRTYLSPIDQDRAEALTFTAGITGLLPLLQRFSRPEMSVRWEQRTRDMLDVFDVEDSDRHWKVYTDQNNMVRSIVRGSLTLQYYDYRDVEFGLRLPFIEKVFIDGHLAYELFFFELRVQRTSLSSDSSGGD